MERRPSAGSGRAPLRACDASSCPSWSRPSARGGGRDEVGVERGEALCERPGSVAPSDGATVDHADAGHATKCAGDERLVCAVALGEREVRLADRNAVLLTQLDHMPSRDSEEAIPPGRRPHLPASCNEEI